MGLISTRLHFDIPLPGLVASGVLSLVLLVIARSAHRARLTSPPGRLPVLTRVSILTVSQEKRPGASTYETGQADR